MARRKIEDDVPLHRKFGYEAMVEKEAIRARLIAEGYEVGSFALASAIERAYEAAHKNDLSYRERQQIWLASQKKAPTSASLDLTEEELLYILYKLAGANEPVGRDVLEKTEKALLRFKKEESDGE